MNFVIEMISTVFALCIHLIVFIDDTIKQLRQPTKITCNFSDHLKLIDQRIKEQSFHTVQAKAQTFESIYVKHIELKQKMMERDRNIIHRMKQIEERMKVLINESEKNTFITLEPFLNDQCHTICYTHEPINYIELNLYGLNYDSFNDSTLGAKGKNCFFEFFLYDINDTMITEFDIDFGIWDIPHHSGGVYRLDEIRKEITCYINEKLNVTMKDEMKYIYSNTKGNSIFFASPCVKITTPSKMYFKRIIISTKDTVVGLALNPQTSTYMDIKPKDFLVRLGSWNDEKTRYNPVKQYSVKVEDKDYYTCIIHNYAPLKVTGNTTVS